jgi:hypothetical protein
MGDDPRLEAFGAHGASLRDELGGVFTNERLQDWIGDIDARRIFLADKILGTISWDKALGKPAAPPLFEGFVVDHAYRNPEIEWGPEGPSDPDLTWKYLEPPVLWDGAEDETHFRVGFFDSVAGAADETIMVRLADRDWEGGATFSGTRRVEPTEVRVRAPRGNPVRLSFDVVARPHFDQQRAGGPLLGGGGSSHSGGSGGGGGAGGA